MESITNAISPLLGSGLGNLAAYLAAHVLLCLVPAFFIAGAMAALIPQEAVTRFLGRDASKAVSYPAAAAAGSGPPERSKSSRGFPNSRASVAVSRASMANRCVTSTSARLDSPSA